MAFDIWAITEILALLIAVIAVYLMYTNTQMAVKNMKNNMKVTEKNMDNFMKQMEQSNAFNLVGTYNEHNWKLYEEHKKEKIPPLLESWDGLSNEEMLWRILIFNHINFLHIAFKLEGTLNDKDYNHLVDMGVYWFKNLKSDNKDGRLETGRKMLKQVLKREEGYPKEFITWLVVNNIISKKFITN